MKDLKDADKKLMDLIFFALDQGIDLVKKGGPLIPFAVTEKEGKKELHRFMGQNLNECVEKAQNFAAQIKPLPDYIAVALEGEVTIEGQKTSTIMVKGFDKTQKEGFILAQRFRPKAFLRKFEIIGNAGYLGNEPNPMTK